MESDSDDNNGRCKKTFEFLTFLKSLSEVYLSAKNLILPNLTQFKHFSPQVLKLFHSKKSRQNLKIFIVNSIKFVERGPKNIIKPITGL